MSRNSVLWPQWWKGGAGEDTAWADQSGAPRVEKVGSVWEFRIDPLCSVEYPQLEHIGPSVSGCGALHVPLQGGLETLLGPLTLLDALFFYSVVPIVRDSQLSMDKPRDVWNEREPQWLRVWKIIRTFKSPPPSRFPCGSQTMAVSRSRYYCRTRSAALTLILVHAQLQKGRWEK